MYLQLGVVFLTLFQTVITENNADKDKLLPAKTYCGYQHSDDYFRNESVIAINEFPWLAGLVYKDDNETIILCSGSLITNRYVLTAAHCIITRTQLVGVRLGEYNIKTDEDCTEDEKFYECSEPPKNFDIEKMIPHPQFNARKFVHDIGLLRLSKTVQYSDYIRPVCLPTAGTIFAKPGDILLTSGWGLKQGNGEQTDTKKKISSKLLTNEECGAVHNYGNVLNENHLCVEELENNTEFSCGRDSGAPMMFPFRNQWHQEGVAAVHIGCHEEYPAIYTKVVNYLDWIKENIQP